MKFTVGDKVSYLFFDEEITGVVRGVFKEDEDIDFIEYAVEFNNHQNGFHDCNGVCEDGYGWWCFGSELKK